MGDLAGGFDPWLPLGIGTAIAGVGDREDMMPLPRKPATYSPDILAAMRADQIRRVCVELAGFMEMAEAGDAGAKAEIDLAFQTARERGDDQVSEIFATALIALAKDPAYTGACTIGAI